MIVNFEHQALSKSKTVDPPVAPPPEASLGTASERIALLGGYLLPQTQLEVLLTDGSSAVRRAAAAHVRAPQDLLISMRRAARLDPQLATSDLERLASGGRYGRELAAKHPLTPPASLERLAQLGCERQLAQNAATPPHVLRWLLEQPELWELLASNPSVSNDDLQRIRSQVSDIDREAISVALCRNPRATPALLLSLAQSDSWEVREALSDDPRLTPDIVDVLGRDRWNADVREAAARHPHAASKTLEQLATDGDDEVRLAVAGNANTPEPALTALARDTLSQVRALVAAHPNSSQQLLDLLTHDAEQTVRRTALARLSSHTPRALADLARDNTLPFKLVAAAYPKTPPEQLERLGADRDSRVRSLAFINPNVPASLLETALHDSRWDVRALAVARQALAAGQTSKRSPDVRLRCMMAATPQLPDTQMRLLAIDPNRSVRLALAANTGTPPELLTKMLEDELLRAVVLENISTTPAVREAVGLIEDREADQQNLLLLRRRAVSSREQTRERVARNVLTPPDLLEQLAADDSLLVREAVLRHPNVTPMVLERFARDPVVVIRSRLAIRPDLSQTALLTLARDADPKIRDLMLRRHDLTEAVLLALSEDSRLEARCIIGAHERTTATILRRLYGLAQRDLDVVILTRADCDETLLQQYELRYVRDPQMILNLLRHPRLPDAVLARIASEAARRFRNPPKNRLLRWIFALRGDHKTWIPVVEAALDNPNLSAVALSVIASSSLKALRPRVRMHRSYTVAVQRALRRAVKVNP